MHKKTIITSQLTRFAKNIFGYDFFVSFKLGGFPVGAQSYASDLARRLRDEDYTVFFSEEEAPPGEQLSPTLTTALHRSRIIVVILNEGALLHSKWMRQEVEEFRRMHPKRPIVAINIDSRNTPLRLTPLRGLVPKEEFGSTKLAKLRKMGP
jgi:hypothetical protein